MGFSGGGWSGAGAGPAALLGTQQAVPAGWPAYSECPSAWYSVFSNQLPSLSLPPPRRRSADAERRQLQGTIKGLQRDVAALQRDVAGRDDAIADKERRILELKHKTQVGGERKGAVWVSDRWAAGWRLSVGSC